MTDARDNVVLAGVSATTAVPGGSETTSTPPDGPELTKGWIAPNGIRALRLLAVVIILGLWQLASGRLIEDFVISNPIDVVRRLWTIFADGTVWPDLGATLQAVVVGYVIGVVSGIAVGIALASWRVVADIVEPLIVAINSIPHIALAPVFLVALGIGLASKVAIVSMMVFFIMFYSMYVGAKDTSRELTDIVRLMGASKMLLVRKVMLPQLASPLVSGLKTSLPLAVIGAVVGEFIASVNGLGHYVIVASENFDSAGIFAGIVLLMAISLTGTTLLSFFERRIFKWK